MPQPATATAAQVTNWFGDIVSKPSVVVEAKSAEDIVRIAIDGIGQLENRVAVVADRART